MRKSENELAYLELKDGTVFHGFSFGSKTSSAGEVVFNTGMVGYVESLTDPSYAGQILILTYPLIGNYGVPQKKYFESERIQVRGLIVSEYSEHYSHYAAITSLRTWLEEEGIPAIYGIDTRALTQKLREKGVMLGKIIADKRPPAFVNPNRENLVAGVSIKNAKTYGKGAKRVLAIDCGMKENIMRSLLSRGVEVKRIPWDFDIAKERGYDGLFISNGPGDPKLCRATIESIKKAMKTNKPIFGICLGSQLLGLAAGAQTYKLPYGHRAQNQPVLQKGTKRCFITSHNHGYSINVKSLPGDWRVSFTNANDKTVEGIEHKKKPWFAVQFHPEASPGPTDTAWLFDKFVSML